MKKIQLIVLQMGSGGHTQGLQNIIDTLNASSDVKIDYQRIDFTEHTLYQQNLPEIYFVNGKINYKLLKPYCLEKVDKIFETISDKEVCFILLCGFKYVLPNEGIFQKLMNAKKILNFHPSYMNTYKGSHAIADALNNQEKYIGTTLHYVDAGVDTGNIIQSVQIPVEGRELLELKPIIVKHELALLHAWLQNLGVK